PLDFMFVKRNRIIAGISEGIIVLEAARKSGTLSTVDFALESGRTVMEDDHHYFFCDRVYCLYGTDVQQSAGGRCQYSDRRSHQFCKRACRHHRAGITAFQLPADRL
ncbi:MAG: DNA-processing protein DprA, partial [Clostridia bacterium]|nr:DNA-processing protein DprA [Clostridia bacterium]